MFDERLIESVQQLRDCRGRNEKRSQEEPKSVFRECRSGENQSTIIQFVERARKLVHCTQNLLLYRRAMQSFVSHRDEEA